MSAHFLNKKSIGEQMKLSNILGPIALVFGLVSSAYSAEQTLCLSFAEKSGGAAMSANPLPVKAGKRTQTSGRVPHVQKGVTPVESITKELHRLAFKLPGVESHPTIVSLAGATGMWLEKGVSIEHPKAIVAGREFSHIHPDGSLHIPLPYKRALEMSEKRWGERHPWADSQDGWEGLVMLYSANSLDELRTVVQLIVESYNHVTGENLGITDDC